MSEPEPQKTTTYRYVRGWTPADDLRIEALLARVEALESVLRAIRDECDDTGGEFWEGTNVATSDRMRALLGEAVDPPNE